MPTYQVALVVDSKTSKEIWAYYESIHPGLPSDFGITRQSIPHLTLAHFKTLKPLSETKIKAIQSLSRKKISVTLAGLRLLPSSEGGTWVEIPALQSKELEKLVEKIVKIVKPCQFINEIGNQFRPHITLCRVQKGKITIGNLDHSLLRKEIKTTLQFGIRSGEFEFKPKK